MGTVHAAPPAAGPPLARIRDLAGRPRGTGFAADRHGTVITSHEAVDGLSRAVVQAPGGRSCLVEAEHITALPEADLALVRTTGLGLDPLVVAAERPHPEGTPVWLWADGRLDARITGTGTATYTSTERYHGIEDTVVLALPGTAAARLRLHLPASGTPVLDASTGAVLAVLGTALHLPALAPSPGAGFAVPLRAAELLDPGGPVPALLRRNGALVPGFGPDLNLAGALRLTAALPAPSADRDRPHIARPGIADELLAFTRSDSGAQVAALVGAPGTGRTTELAALVADRARSGEPAPTVWLRGADLWEGDGSVRAAVGRALAEADRRRAADTAADGGATAADAGTHSTPAVGGSVGVNPDVVARLARTGAVGRALLVVLDGPEETLPGPGRELRSWVAGTASWLRTSSSRLVLACRPEFWEQTGPLFPEDMLYVPRAPGGHPAGTAGNGYGPGPSGPLPPHIPVGDLPPSQAARLRTAYGLPDGATAHADAGHPLSVRMLGEVWTAMAAGSPHGPAGRPADPDGPARSGQPPSPPPQPPPGRPEIFSAHLALAGLRIAVRLAARRRPAPDAGSVRRLAARAAGQIHEAARRCLRPRQGALDTRSFDELFPWHSGWGPAVLAERVLVPAGDGYRFADEEFGDWLQAHHLGLDAALDALVHRREGAAPDGGPVPRHRIGPVVQALLLCGSREGPQALARRLHPLIGPALPAGPRPAPGHSAEAEAEPEAEPVPDGDAEAAWWAAELLGETLLRLPGPVPYRREPYRGVLERLANRISGQGATGGFGPAFWRGLPLDTAGRCDLLRRLLPADRPPGGAVARSGARFLDEAAALLAAEPGVVAPLLCAWFEDGRPLTDGPGSVTVAGAAQALLHTHRRRDLGALTEALADALPHPRARELLAELARDETTALCRAVDRWACDPRPQRRAAARAFGVRAARHAGTEADREPLRRAALGLLARAPAGADGDTAALALLVRDPGTRDRYLDVALRRFVDTGAPALAGALGTALATRPEPVLTALRTRLRSPDGGPEEALRALAEAPGPEGADGIAELLRAYAAERPGEVRATGEAVAGFVARRLGHGTPPAGHTLAPLVGALLRAADGTLRVPLGRTLGAGEGPVRDRLLADLLAAERDPPVLDAVLAAAAIRPRPAAAASDATDAADSAQARLTLRVGLLMSRTPQGAALFDRRLVALARDLPGFAARLRRWTTEDPDAWAALIGPSAARACAATVTRPGAGQSGAATAPA